MPITTRTRRLNTCCDRRAPEPVRLKPPGACCCESNKPIWRTYRALVAEFRGLGGVDVGVYRTQTDKKGEFPYIVINTRGAFSTFAVKDNVHRVRSRIEATYGDRGDFKVHAQVRKTARHDDRIDLRSTGGSKWADRLRGMKLYQTYKRYIDDPNFGGCLGRDTRKKAERFFRDPFVKAVYEADQRPAEAPRTPTDAERRWLLAKEAIAEFKATGRFNLEVSPPSNSPLRARLTHLSGYRGRP